MMEVSENVSVRRSGQEDVFFLCQSGQQLLVSVLNMLLQMRHDDEYNTLMMTRQCYTTLFQGSN